MPRIDPSHVRHVWPDPDNGEFELTVILKLYCQIEDVLREQFTRFDASGSVSSPIINALIRAETNKGPLWWLKDSSRNVLGKPSAPLAAQLLDWGIGYLFHEVVKLIETTHQQRRYLPMLRDFDIYFPPSDKRGVDTLGTAVRREVSEDLARSMRRTRILLRTVRRFFIPAYAGLSAYLSIARFLYQNDTLVRSVFADEYGDLIASIYGPAPETLYIAAGRSLFDGGYFGQAAEAAGKALELAPGNPEARELLGMAANPPPLR